MLASSCMAALALVSVHATDIHVATNGNDGNNGAESTPLLTIGKALEIVQPGDRILIHEGTYNITKRLKIPALNTTPETRCEMRAWPEDAVGKVIIDGSQMVASTEIEFKQSRCIYVNHEANYWTFYGLTLQNALDNGMKMEGSYNIVERCVFRWNNDTGLQIGMYKDFKIEETKSFPISGQPAFNPNYTYCRGNKVINCDSYENADLKSFSGSDDGGDADGFACKLFPGPGTEFRGCRAWTNSDDNWDLYMVYHPVVIDHCWAWHAGYLKSGGEGKNGNGFKLGGGGSAGGAAFAQSTGAHVVTNCVAFENLHKGFDQNNAYEGMYVINCTAWGNEYNYRFPTVFEYGPMTIRNSIGWGAKAEKSGVKVGNHEFLSEDKEGYIAPDTKYCSWLEFDGCNPIKEGMKDANKNYLVTKDHSGEFLSLKVEDFMAPREADGSLPNNNFARLKPDSKFKDAGTPIIGFTPARKMTEAQCTAAGVEYITIDDLYIPYNDAAPDLGAYETDGVPYEDYVIPEKIEVTCISANSSQEVVKGKALQPIVYEWNAVGTGATVENLPAGLSYNVSGNQLTISGTPTQSGTFTLNVSGDASQGVKPVVTTGIITLVIPFKVLTGDWYPFQDAEDQLPDDLKEALVLIDGDKTEMSGDNVHTKGDTYIDPTREDSGVSFGSGALCMGESNGGFKLNLKDGVLQMKVNLLITGDRKYDIIYELEGDATPHKTTTDKLSKGEYSWDILEQAGLTNEADLLKVRSITFQQNGAKGGTRIYEMYVRVPLNETGVNNINANENANLNATPAKVVVNGRIAIIKNGVRYDLMGREF